MFTVITLFHVILHSNVLKAAFRFLSVHFSVCQRLAKTDSHSHGYGPFEDRFSDFLGIHHFI